MDKKSGKKIGLALGGGGARGLAHIGIIKILEQAGIPIDFIAGTSMGALVGGFYAATKDIKALEDIFLNIRKKDIFSASAMLIGRKDDPFKSEIITDFLVSKLDGKNIQDCSVPFRAIAMNVENGEETEFSKGPLVEAIRASSALPILMKPIKIGDKIFADGAFVNNIPADVVKRMGADIVIAIDVSKGWIDFSEASINIKHAYSLISNIIDGLVYQLAKKKLEAADFVLRPAVFNYETLAFSHAKDIIAAGEKEVKEHLKELQQKTGIYKEIPKTILEKIIDFIFTE
ncbi:MAG: patatin-like phospholipase family protein [Candidatus Paceibacterota bacterium]|jgi:NTE family protein